MLILLVSVLFTAGCTENPNNSASTQEIQEKSVVVNMTDLEQINTSIQEGPVFVKIGSEGCYACREMEPILSDLAAEYTGKITVMSGDIGKNPQIGAYFEAYYIPDSFVIVGIENGEYVYMQEDGNITTDRFQARVQGLREKQVFEELIKRAVLYYENGNAK
ncbi:thioredoxin-like protein [Methanosarcina sp. WWM596]|nr:thioredoxin-like protein [Methanosarcina sp. WWM596]